MRGRQPQPVAHRHRYRLGIVADLPGRLDYLVEQGAGGAQRRLGGCRRGLGRRTFRQGPSGPKPFLAAGQLDQIVNRGARIAQRSRANRQREKSKHRKAIQRPVHDWSVKHREHAISGHEDVVGNAVVAAGATQTQCVPSVEDLQLVLVQRDDRRHLPVVDEAAGEHDVRVVDPAAKRPASGHHDTAVDGPGRATWRPPPRRDTPPPAEHFLAAARRQVGDQQGTGNRDRHTPSR
ncbi:Uncharacterised protein [Mycobacterium tuberculosis]|nr:Uncharacterised protein [Mycobacterium tuberculosis]